MNRTLMVALFSFELQKQKHDIIIALCEDYNQHLVKFGIKILLLGCIILFSEKLEIYHARLKYLVMCTMY